MSEPLLTFILTAYHPTTPQIMVGLGSLICQTDQRFKVLILHDGPIDNLDLYTLRDKLNCKLNEQKIFVDRTETRENCYGHNLRALGIEAVDTPFLAIGNLDNYYTPKFVELMLKTQEEYNADFIYCPTLHNYANLCFGGHEYTVLDTQLAESHIDMASFICRTSIAKKCGFKSREFAADWHFIRDFLNTANSAGSVMAVKIPNCLVCHN